MNRDSYLSLSKLIEKHTFEGIWPHLDYVSVHYDHPQDTNHLLNYLQQTFVGKSIWIVGAGTHGLFAYNALKSLPNTRIKGFIDRSGSNSTINDLPCLKPSSIKSNTIHENDVLIICHPFIENALSEALPDFVREQSQKVMSSRDFSTYTNTVQLETIEKECATIAQNKRFLVVSTLYENWTIIPNNQLVDIFPSKETLHLVYGREERYSSSIERFENDVFETKHIGMSLKLLSAIIKKMHPDILYVRVSPYFEGEFLVPYIKSTFPKLKIVAEHYDLSFMLSDKRLSNDIGYGTKDIEVMKSSSVFGLKFADVFITKNGGAAWNEICKDHSRIPLSLFPLPKQWETTIFESEPKQKPEKIRILYAGSLPNMSEKKAIPVDMRYYDYFEMLADDIYLDIYNAQHIHAEQDTQFGPFIELAKQRGNTNYYRFTPATEVKENMAQYSAGWLASHDGTKENVEHVSRHVMGNKFLSYLMAGLPVIIDDSYDFINSLIEKFPVCLKVDIGNKEKMNRQIRNADYGEMRQHIPQLLEYLAEINQCSVERLTSTLRLNKKIGTE